MQFDRFETDNTVSQNAQEGRGYTRAALPTLELVHRGYHSRVEDDEVASFWTPHRETQGEVDLTSDKRAQPSRYAVSHEEKVAACVLVVWCCGWSLV